MTPSPPSAQPVRIAGHHSLSHQTIGAPASCRLARRHLAAGSPGAAGCHPASRLKSGAPRHARSTWPAITTPGRKRRNLQAPEGESASEITCPPPALLPATSASRTTLLARRKRTRRRSPLFPSPANTTTSPTSTTPSVRSRRKRPPAGRREQTYRSAPTPN